MTASLTSTLSSDMSGKTNYWRTSGCAVWLTGLPSSGKSTLAHALFATLRRRRISAEILDGDDVRRGLSPDLGFTRSDRDEHIRRIGFVCSILARHGIIAISAAISPYASARLAVRNQLRKFLEVYVRCPLAVCMERDPKGLYAKALRGDLEHFTGISDPYEEPEAAVVVVDTAICSVDSEVDKIVSALFERGYLWNARRSKTDRKPAVDDGQVI